MQASPPSSRPTRYRPSVVSVFAAAFVAGAVVAFGLNRMLDVHLARSRPQVESVPIFVALRSLPQGAPVTVWDVALRDWPKAMLPTTALEANDSFEGMILKHPLREGQPLLSVQLMRAEPRAASEPQPQDEVFAAPTPADPQPRQPEIGAWTPVSDTPATPSAVATPVAVAGSPVEPSPAEPIAAQPDVSPPANEQAGTEKAGTQQADRDQTVAEETVTEQGTPEQLPTVSIAATPTVDPVPTQDFVPAPGLPSAAVADPEDAAMVSDELTEAVIEDGPTEPTLADTPPPVPASPAIDIERPLKAMTSQRSANRGPAFTETPYAGPAVAESVLAAAPAEAAASAPAAASDPTPQPLRYLVVPERIALEADASFAEPPAPPTVAAPAPVPANRSTAASAGPQPQPQRQPQRQGQPQTPATTAPTQAQRPRGAWFPNIAAGLEALGAPTRGSEATPPKRAR